MRDVTPDEPAEGGFAAKANAARIEKQEPPAADPEDAGEAVAEVEGDQPAAAEDAEQPDAEDVQEAAEPSAFFAEGVAAAEEGKGPTDCPYEPPADDAMEWLAGCRSVMEKTETES